MIRLQIDLPRDNHSEIITSRDAVKNILDTALRRYGAPVSAQQPAPYGFGVVARRVTTPGPRLYRVERVIVGSTHPAFASALAQLQPDDLLEPNAVSGVGLDLRHARIKIVPPPVFSDAVALYAVSPLRVLDAPTGQSLLTLGPVWEQALNRTMSRRFARPFTLRFIPDSLYVRARQGRIVARMAVKVRSDGYVVAYPGLVLPFVLAGPADQLASVWYNGLGSSTAMGFGCVEVQTL